jgi:hypothetical protein
VWLAPVQDGGDGQQAWALAVGAAEDLVDLAWAPDGRHLLLVGRQQPNLGAERTSLRWLDVATGEASMLALLPSEVVPGSYAWSPDGHAVAFVVHTAQLAAVCLLSDAGAFRYLGDLGHDGLAGPPVAPVAWAPGGRLLYGALLRQAPANTTAIGLFGRPAVGLYLTEPFSGLGQPIGGEAGLVPLWRPDGARFAVGLPAGQASGSPLGSLGPGGVPGGLRVRALEDDGQVRDVAGLDLPTPGATAYGVRWDLAHRRALVITNRGSGDGPAHEYWLVDFGWGTGA